MQKTSGEIVFIVTTLLVIFLVITMVTLFIVFSRRKDKLLREKEQVKKRYEQEIAQVQIEVREETLKNISWELHDNIGQLLTLAKIQMQNATPDNIDEITQTISKSLDEVRSLSKMINPDYIKNIHLKEAVLLEVERFNRLNYIDASLVNKGKEQEINHKHSTIIFRMLQEFFSNTIKHSKAEKLEVLMNYKEKYLQITAKDNGVGFEFDNNFSNGIGLQNIKSRAKLINADVTLNSVSSEGTSLEIKYYF